MSGSGARLLGRNVGTRIRRVVGSDAWGHVWCEEAGAIRGETIRRCLRCAVCSHWPLASEACVPSSVVAKAEITRVRSAKRAAAARAMERRQAEREAKAALRRAEAEQREADRKRAACEYQRQRRERIKCDPVALAELRATNVRNVQAYRARKAAAK